MKKRIILAGGSGFLGRALTDVLTSRGCDIVILTRTPRRSLNNAVAEARWDGRTLGDWLHHIDGADAIINLTGRNVNCRYTPENRREIIASRVDSVNVLSAAAAQCATPPRVWIQASSLAIHGDAGGHWCDEDSLPGTGFPVETCLLWERAFNGARLPATRKACLRISFALARGEGALRTLERITRCGLGGSVGTGRQYISWIHNADLVRMFLWALERDDISGVYNATSPHPETNAVFMREMRRVLHRPWSPPVPAIAARIGAFLMRTEASLALTGRRGDPRRFHDLGFPFEFPHLRPALENIYSHTS